MDKDVADVAAEIRGLLALLVLALVPGLAVVRAPWLAVPFLSLSFWVLSALWVRTARSAFVGAALVFFVLLVSLRLLKPLPAGRPSGRSRLLLALALACLLPTLVLPVAPGLALPSTEATLLRWRDGFPSTYEPLAPIPAFGAHAPGLPGLAADVSRLSGLAPYRAVLQLAFAGAGLLVLGVGSLFERWGAVRRGLGAAVLVALVALLPAVLAHPGGPAPGRAFLLALSPGPGVLAAAFGSGALALLVRGSGRAPAVAAGVLLGAAFVVEAGVAVVLFGLVAWRGDPARRRVALGLALVLALPHLASFRALSLAELRTGVLQAGAALRPSGQGPALPDAATMRAFAWLAAHTDPLARVCAAPPAAAAAFLPAVAQRALLPAEVPPVYREEASGGPVRRCNYLLSLGPPFLPLVPAGAPFDPSGRIVYRDGHARVLDAASLDAPVTSFDNEPGNRSVARP